MDIIKDPFFKERTNLHHRSYPQEECSRTSFVLYVVTNTYRTQQNPALDVATRMSRAFDVPLMVFLFFDDSIKFATQRRARFVLEAVKEMQENLRREGVLHMFCCYRAGHRQPRHLTLASRACVVVTDEPFVMPYTKVVSQLTACGTPLITVDNHCIFPARSVPIAWTRRAYVFRAKTSAGRKKRLVDASYPYTEPLPAHLLVGSERVAELQRSMSFSSSVDLTKTTISSALTSMALDNSVRSVAHTPGGTSHARRRWREFLSKGGLKRYHKRRNDPLASGVSRLSAYLNLGMISPFQISRDVLDAMTRDPSIKPGGEKYLDEFWIWRELAHAMCFRYPKHLTLSSVLPNWALETLRKHANDPRRVVNVVDLEHGRTGLRLWDIAQRSLRDTGELHNNLRMTWGKEVLNWVAGSAQRTYETLVHLNDKFALDGTSPPSYAGLLWCMGWADSPKPERPIFGRVRFRSASSISRRYDLNALETRLCFDATRASAVAPESTKQRSITQFFKRDAGGEPGSRGGERGDTDSKRARWVK